MRTQYFLMLPTSFQRETKRLILLFNVGIITATSVAAGSSAHNANTILQDNTVAEILPCVNAPALQITSQMESFFQPDEAYWCTGSTASYKNTPSS